MKPEPGGVTHYIPDRAKVEMQGVCSWDNPKNKYRVLRVHYTADPEKRSRKWLDSMQRGQLANPHSWGQEMEIDPYALSGTRVYDEFTNDHIVDNLTADELNAGGVIWYFGLDYGGRMSPTCALWWAVGPAQVPVTCFEYYRTGLTIQNNAKNILAFEEANKIKPRYRVLDPHAWNDNGHGMCIADEYSSYGIRCIKARNQIEYGIERLRKLLADGRHYVMKRCVNTIREYQTYRHREYSDTELQSKDPVDKPLDRDNHAMDVERYLAVENPRYKEPEPVPDEWERLATKRGTWV